MGLDTRGYISIGEAIIYVPVFCLALFLALRHGFKRESGWIYLVIFAVSKCYLLEFIVALQSLSIIWFLVRAVGSGMYVAAELIKPENQTIFTTAVIMESIGLSPLLLATLGFLGLMYARLCLIVQRRLTNTYTVPQDHLLRTHPLFVTSGSSVSLAPLGSCFL